VRALHRLPTGLQRAITDAHLKAALPRELVEHIMSFLDFLPTATLSVAAASQGPARLPSPTPLPSTLPEANLRPEDVAPKRPSTRGRGLEFSVRDLLAWVNFINTTAHKVGDIGAYLHGSVGAFMKFIGELPAWGEIRRLKFFDRGIVHMDGDPWFTPEVENTEAERNFIEERNEWARQMRLKFSKPTVIDSQTGDINQRSVNIFRQGHITLNYRFFQTTLVPVLFDDDLKALRKKKM